MVESCNICSGNSFKTLVDLGKIPLGFPVSVPGRSEIWKEELILEMCENCSFVRSVRKIPSRMLKGENLYTSAVSKNVRKHYDLIVSYVKERSLVSKDELILEIGCGDGSLLRKFYENNFRNLIGVEPSIHENVEYDFDVINEYFDSSTAEKLTAEGKTPKLILVNSVAEVVPDITSFFKNISGIMDENSYLFFEIPSFALVYGKKRIDCFDHLNCNWFTLKSLMHLFDKFALNVMDIENDSEYRGENYFRMVLRKAGGINHVPVLNGHLEKESEVIGVENLNRFGKEFQFLKSDIKKSLDNLQNNNFRVVGYGGGLKSSTLLNWLELRKGEIEFAVDRDRNKENKFIPLLDIPIYSVDKLLERSDDRQMAVLNLAIDHKAEVEEYLSKNLMKGDLVVNLLPEFYIREIDG